MLTFPSSSSQIIHYSFLCPDALLGALKAQVTENIEQGKQKNSRKKTDTVTAAVHRHPLLFHSIGHFSDFL